jgi:predicted ferric reductase
VPRLHEGDAVTDPIGRPALPPAALGALYVAAVLAPLALSWAGMRPPRGLWNDLGAGAGMLAYSVILAEFLLSGRFRTVSGGVGMDITMRFHQLFARSALLLAMVHPFLYAGPFNPPMPGDPTRALTLTADLSALWSGMAAFALLPAFVLTAMRRKDLGWRYERWRFAHGVGALAIAGLLLHHTLAAGRYAADPVLAGLWIGLFAVAALSLVWVYWAKPALQLRRPWRVRSVAPAGLRSWELTLTPDGHVGLRSDAGQFAWINVGHSPFSLNENPFSISSAPGAGPEISFVIKELGDFTNAIGQATPGTRVYVDGPFGHLTVAGADAPGVALIAGGVGIAPMMGILRQRAIDGDARPFALVCGAGVEGGLPCRAEIDDFAKAGLEVTHVLGAPPPGWTGRTGRIDPALIADLFGAPARRDWLYVLCGPPAMLASVEDALIALGVPAGRILSERFDYD